MSDQCRALFEVGLSEVLAEKLSDGSYSTFWVQAEWTVWQGAWQAARRAEPERLYKGINRHGVDARYFEEKLRLLIRDLGDYQADELRRVFERLAGATGAEPEKVEPVWIPVSERLPSERCLAFTPDNTDKNIQYRIVPAGLFRQAASDATHWMPLPAAPQQEQK